MTPEYVTTLSTGTMTFVHQLLINVTKILLLNRGSYLKKIRRIGLDEELRAAQKHMQGLCNFREGKFAVSDEKRIKFSNLANQKTKKVSTGFTFMVLTKTILNFDIQSENEYDVKYVVNRTENIVKDVRGSTFFT